MIVHALAWTLVLKFFTDFFRIVFEWEHNSRLRYSRDSKPSSMHRDARFLRARIELQFVFESKSGLKSMLFQLGRDWSTE